MNLASQFYKNIYSQDNTLSIVNQTKTELQSEINSVNEQIFAYEELLPANCLFNADSSLIVDESSIGIGIGDWWRLCCC